MRENMVVPEDFLRELLEYQNKPLPEWMTRHVEPIVWRSDVWEPSALGLHDMNGID